MYTLKSIARRASALGSALALLVSAIVPAAPVFADALNPLTDRSLTLSSSAPGWDYKDGSGNTTYAPPNSGANGQKTGNYFDFKVSSDTTGTPLKAMTFQYCKTSAGSCLAPGDNGWSGTAPSSGTRNGDSTTTSDLNVNVASPSQVEAADNLTDYVNLTGGAVTAIPAATSTGLNYAVIYKTGDNGTPGDETDDPWASSDGWTMTVHNKETGTVLTKTATGKMNQIELVNKTPGQGFTSGQEVKVLFFATNTNYITNPGSGAFFVRINTYKDVDNTDTANPVINPADLADGGVTVANVMNQSIWIQTKVLETMDFSVGTIDPNTLSGGSGNQLETATGASAQTQHTPCDRILTRMNPADTEQNILKMGDPSGEYSLATDHTYSTHSYWRLSSNSSAGATVYYSGNTLSNTVGDKIKPIDNGSGNAVAPIEGSEQFGLALANGTSGNYTANYSRENLSGKIFEYGADDAAAGLVALTADQDPGPSTGVTGIHSSTTTDVGANPSYHFPQLAPLVPDTQYQDGAGIVNTEYGTVNTKFAFNENSQQIPIALASEDDQVVDCVTGKMRYIANIAATTPAGIYTTKINYIAAPQY